MPKKVLTKNIEKIQSRTLKTANREVKYAAKKLGVNTPDEFLNTSILSELGVTIENEKGDFKNDYRFMNAEIINEKLKTVKFKGVKWDVEIEPTVASVQRFNFQATANTEHNSFVVRTEDGNLIFTFGDQSSHGGEFVFANDVQGTLNKGWSWPVAQVLQILRLSDSAKVTLHFSNEGAMQVSVDSGIGKYQYIIPAQAQ